MPANQDKIYLDFGRERHQRLPERFLLAVPVSGPVPAHVVRAWQSALVDRLGRVDVDQIHNLRSASLRVEGNEVQIVFSGSQEAVDDWTAQRRLHTAVQESLDQVVAQDV